MECQELYRLRDQYEFCSGLELQEWFVRYVGEPSPSGHVPIDEDAAVDFILECCADMAHNSPSLKEYCEKVKREARARLTH